MAVIILILPKSWTKVNRNPWRNLANLGDPKVLPSGELTFCYGKSPFFMGKCYVSSPEGIPKLQMEYPQSYIAYQLQKTLGCRSTHSKIISRCNQFWDFTQRNIKTIDPKTKTKDPRVRSERQRARTLAKKNHPVVKKQSLLVFVAERKVVEIARQTVGLWLCNV